MLRERAEDAAMAARLGRDLPRFVRAPLTLEAAQRRIRVQLEQREQRFLRTVEPAVYGVPRSPYRRLLDQAGCEWGDVQRLVGQEGIEGALRRLAEAGVYVSFDEFKGRREAVRGSARFTFSDRDFDNPFDRGHYLELTGGSRGRPTRVPRSLGSVRDIATSFAPVLEAHGIRSPRILFWHGASLSWAFVHLKLGNPLDAWFYPVEPLPRLVRLAHAYVGLLTRLVGRQLPPLRYCDVQAPEAVVERLTSGAEDDRPILMNGTTSSAVRVALAAALMGRSLDGVTFHTRSEPLTASRRRSIEAVGARVLPDYASIELSSIAYACAAGTSPDDLHLCADRHAVIQRERAVFEGGPLVDALLFTGLSPFAPKIALNVELGDSARVEERACGCSLGSLGLRIHLSGIRSFEKVSSEGTTFARSNLLQILEEVLPARFGGSGLDYQLVEEEGTDGSTVLVLRVHPGVGEADEEALRGTVLRELAGGGMADAYQAELLRRAESIVVRRLPPLTTGAGKVLPFHLAGATVASHGS